MPCLLNSMPSCNAWVVREPVEFLALSLLLGYRLGFLTGVPLSYWYVTFSPTGKPTAMVWSAGTHSACKYSHIPVLAHPANHVPITTEHSRCPVPAFFCFLGRRGCTRADIYHRNQCLFTFGILLLYDTCSPIFANSQSLAHLLHNMVTLFTYAPMVLGTLVFFAILGISHINQGSKAFVSFYAFAIFCSSISSLVWKRYVPAFHD